MSNTPNMTTVQKGLSIKYKLLIALTVLPLFMLGSYLILAIGIFKDDKIAYVFESSSAVARTLAAQAGTELTSTLVSVRPVIQEYLNHDKFDVVAKGFFQSEGPIQWIAVYGRASEKPEEFALLGKEEREDGSLEADLAKGFAMPVFIKDTLVRQRLVQMPFQDDRVLVSEKVNTEKNGEKIELVFVFATQLPQTVSTFRTPGSAENFLVDQSGHVLFGSAQVENQDLTLRLGEEYFAKTKEQKFANGAESLDSKQGQQLLASYAKVSYGDLLAVSLVPQKEALKAVGTLVQRSIIFLMILLSLTVVLSLVASGNLTAALTDLFQATKKVSEGNFDVQVKVQSTDEIGSLAGSFNVMAAEVSRLMMETAEKARMESELKTAQTVQETLFPAAEANLPGMRVSGYYEPASECGGDWWHYCEVQGKYFFWIGDATGHGAPAALITSAAKSAATIIEKLNVPPAEALALLNRSIHEVSRGRIMMTFFLGCYDPKTREFLYANGSHEAPYLIKKSDQPPKKKDLIPLNEVNSPRLGQARDTEYEQTKVTLDVGDRILFYTDGIPDIQNSEQTSWGEREFIKAILASNGTFPPVSEVVRDLVTRFSGYRQGSSLIDDITFFMIEVTPVEETKAS